MLWAAGVEQGRVWVVQPKPVGRAVELPQRSKFSVSGLKREPGLKLES